LQLEVCAEQVEWAKTEKRTFLRQRIEARLANLYLSMKDYSSALSLISRLLTEASYNQRAPCKFIMLCCRGVKV
jgi:26S proteasome regulatory subunit N6